MIIEKCRSAALFTLFLICLTTTNMHCSDSHQSNQSILRDLVLSANAEGVESFVTTMDYAVAQTDLDYAQRLYQQEVAKNHSTATPRAQALSRIVAFFKPRVAAKKEAVAAEKKGFVDAAAAMIGAEADPAKFMANFMKEAAEQFNKIKDLPARMDETDARFIEDTRTLLTTVQQLQAMLAGEYDPKALEMKAGFAALEAEIQARLSRLEASREKQKADGNCCVQ